MSTKIFPTILIALDLAAGLVYATKSDWNMLWYWISAALITASVTYKI